MTGGCGSLNGERFLGASSSLKNPCGDAAEAGDWQEAWQRAAAARPELVSETFFQFAGATVRARIVGAELSGAVTRAFRHLGAPATPRPQLRIDLWDERVTSVPRPANPPPSSTGCETRIGSSAVSIRDGGRVFSTERGRDSTAWLDRASSTLIGWHRDASDMPFVEYSKPLSMPLRVWYYDRDIDIVHACLVAREGAGILVGGPSGAGKSTTALACGAAGFDCIGDDEVGLRISRDKDWVGYGLFNSTRVRPGSEALVAGRDDLPAPRSDPESGKLLYFLSEIAPRPVPPAATVQAAVFPRIADTLGCRIRPIEAREALLRLGGTTLFGPLGMGERAFLRLKRLFAVVPAYELELGRNWKAAPACIDGILARGTR